MSPHFNITYIYNTLLLTIGLVKHKGKYIVMGLPNSGKASLIKLLFEEGLIDCIPYPPNYNDVNSSHTKGEFHRFTN